MSPDDIHSQTRRTVLQKGGLALAAGVGTVLGSSGAAAADWEYEMRIESTGGQCSFFCNWDSNMELVETENFEWSDRAGDGYVDVSVDGTFSPTYDIVRYNAGDGEPHSTRSSNSEDLRVTVNGDVIRGLDG